MKNTLEFIQAGADVRRYHTIYTLQAETVGHHSHGVACLCLLLDPKCSRDVLTAALRHDLAEHVTGDIPSPAKHEYGIGDHVSALEERLLDSVGLGLSRYLTPPEKRVLKLADILQGALFCAREISLGNQKMRAVFDRYLSYAEAFVLVGLERELFNLIREQVK